MKSGETNTKPRSFTHGHKPSTLNATRKTYFLLKVFSFFFYAFILCFLDFDTSSVNWVDLELTGQPEQAMNFQPSYFSC